MQLDDLNRSLEAGAIAIELNNPSCGDRITLQLQLEDGVVKDAKFKGEGCSISMASASMMTEAVKGRTPEQVLELAGRFSRLMKVSRWSLTNMRNWKL